MEFRYLLEIIRRRPLVFFSILLLPVAISLVASFAVKDIYKVSSRLIIKKKDIQSYFPYKMPNAVGEVFYLDSKSYYYGFPEIVGDKGLLKKVIDDLHLDAEVDSFKPSIPFLTFATFYKKSGVYVERIEESDVYEIDGYANSPGMAEAISNGLLNAFMVKDQEMNRLFVQKLKSLLKDHIKKMEDRLRSVEKEKEEFIASAGVNQAIIDAKKQLVQLQMELAAKETEFKPGHVEVISLKNKIKSIQNVLDMENKKYYSAEKSIKAEGIDKELDLLRADLFENHQNYNNLMLVEKMKINNAEVLRFADAKLDGINRYPSRMKLVLFFGFIGIALSFFAVLLMEYLDESCKYSHDIESAANSLIIFDNPRIKKLKINSLLSGDKCPLELRDIAWNLGSAFRLSQDRGTQRVVAVTSCLPGEGKTTISSFLARALAGLGERVLLIEANRRPVLGGASGRAVQHFFDDLVENPSSLDQVAVAIAPNLHLAAGRAVDDHLGTMYSNRMATLFETLRTNDRYDRIVIDLPSLSDDNSASYVASYSDVVIMVVARGKVDRSLLQVSFRNIRAVRNDLQIKLVTNTLS